MDAFDFVVIGAGPGGYVAAIRGAQNGLRTAVVERDDRLGGTCLLRGCIPTKSLLHAADVWDTVRRAADFGVATGGGAKLDYAGVRRAQDKVIAQSARGVDYLMKKNKIEVIRGHGRLAGPGVVEVATVGGPPRTLRAPHVVVATGSVPRQIPGLTPDGRRIVTSDELLQLAEPPPSMIVLGGGAVGVEFASVFSRFGTNVTVVEMQPTVLPVEDTDVGREFERLLGKRGVTCLTGCRLARVEDGPKKTIRAHLRHGEQDRHVDAAMLLVAIGRAPVTADVGLGAAGVDCDEGGYVTVDAHMRTSQAGVFAIGDVVRSPWLAHVASAEGTLVADLAAGRPARPINYLQTPSCTYAEPEVASVGLTQRAAEARGLDVKVGKFPFSAVAKARIGGHTDGFVKLVMDARYGEILGVHIIGPRATDLIAEACVALRAEMTMEELANTIHAHPTYAEALLEGAHATLGHALHL